MCAVGGDRRVTKIAKNSKDYTTSINIRQAMLFETIWLNLFV